MNKFATGLLVGTIIVETSALAAGVYYALRTKKELDNELDRTKQEVNKTVHKFAAVLAEFQV
jgi:hypothetical protein